MSIIDIDRDWLLFPERCSATVAKGPRHNKEEQPCDKPAVAVALYDGEEFEPHAYPVCKHHARGRTLYLLKDVIAVSQAKREKYLIGMSRYARELEQRLERSSEAKE